MNDASGSRNADANPEPGARGALDVGAFVTIDGVEQWITIRGASARNPVVLVISGAGGALSPFAPVFATWERHFTVVQWDQPGAGATYGKNGDERTGPITIERLVRDAAAVAEHVRERLSVPRLAVLGFSAGTIVTLALAQRRPDLLYACVNSGQVVHWARQEARSYALVLERARAAGDAAAVAELERLGPPPYSSTAADAIKSKYAGAFTEAERSAWLGVLPQVQAPPAGASYAAHGVPLDDPLKRATAVYDRLRPEIVAFDAFALGRSFATPLFFFQGEHDAYTVTSLVEEYVAAIDAPRKVLAVIPGAGHSTFLLGEPLLELMLKHVLPLAPAGGSGRPGLDERGE